MFTLPELIELRNAAKDAYLKSLKAQSTQVGSGHGARMLTRNTSDALKVELDDWSRQIAAHPDNTVARAVRRVRYLRPNC